MKEKSKKGFWHFFAEANENEKNVEKKNVEYQNEVKIEMSLPGNDEFLIATAIAFVEPLQVTTESIECVKKMVADELVDFSNENPDEKKIIFKMGINHNREFYVESECVKKDW